MPLLQLIFFAQVLQGMLLPAELVLMLIIINRKRVMGEHTNGPLANTIGWTTAIVIGLLSLLYVRGAVYSAASRRDNARLVQRRGAPTRRSRSTSGCGLLFSRR